MKIIDGDKIVDVTPELIAFLFCEMDSEGQAKFYNEVGVISDRWQHGGLPMQMQYVTDEDGLTLRGRMVMSYIGDYSHWGLVPHAYKLFKELQL